MSTDSHSPKISTIQNGPLTTLQPYGALFFASSIVTLVILCNVLERGLLQAIYGKLFVSLLAPGKEKQRRSFTYYHVGVINIIVILCMAIYPVTIFLAGSAVASTPMLAGSRTTVGDVLFVVANAFTAYYVFELCYRTKFASPLSIAHHVGLIAITQTSVSLFGNWEKYPEATMEFYMCMIWGFFDVVVELPIFISMIIWRTRRHDSKLLAYLTGGLCVWALIGALTEVIVTIYMLHASWDRWGDVWKVVTPVIFSLWISAQLYGASRLYAMSQSEWGKHTRGTSEVAPVVELHQLDSEKDLASVSSAKGVIGENRSTSAV